MQGQFEDGTNTVLSKPKDYTPPISKQVVSQFHPSLILISQFLNITFMPSYKLLCLPCRRFPIGFPTTIVVCPRLFIRYIHSYTPYPEAFSPISGLYQYSTSKHCLTIFLHVVLFSGKLSIGLWRMYHEQLRMELI
jgi:hypothetical protein